MRYNGLYLYVFGALIFLMGFGLENCTMGATDKVGLSIAALVFLEALAFSLIIFDHNQGNSFTFWGFLPIILFSSLFFLIGIDIISQDGSYQYCDGWTVEKLRELDPSVSWYGWIILALSLAGLAMPWIYKKKRSSLPTS